MNFDLSDEQQLLQDSVTRFVADHYGLEARRELAASAAGFSAAHWQTFSELGWLALPFPEADGGIDGNAIDTMVLMEQFGRGLVLEPYLATVILGGGAIARTTHGEQRAALLGGIIDGSLQLAFAHTEEQAPWDLHDVTTTARVDGKGFRLNGTKSVVLNAPNADFLVVTGRTSGAQRDTEGLSLFLVDPDADGVTVYGYPTVDGGRGAEVSFDDVRLGAQSMLGAPDKAWDTIAAVANEATLALCAEALGGMEALYTSTVDYTQERTQFDHPISDFQVLQHRMVEMFMEYEQCRSMVYRATMEFVQNGHEAARTISGCKHLIGTAGTFIAENAVQLHGGMGVTEELAIGHYFKRQLVIDSQFGNADHHLERFAA